MWQAAGAKAYWRGAYGLGVRLGWRQGFRACWYGWRDEGVRGRGTGNWVGTRWRAHERTSWWVPGGRTRCGMVAGAQRGEQAWGLITLSAAASLDGKRMLGFMGYGTRGAPSGLCVQREPACFAPGLCTTVQVLTREDVNTARGVGACCCLTTYCHCGIVLRMCVAKRLPLHLTGMGEVGLKWPGVPPSGSVSLNSTRLCSACRKVWAAGLRPFPATCL